jgi:ATP-dependent Lhr-like helicase
VTGFGGEQFALPEAVESLRLSRRGTSLQEIVVSAADPMNLAGIVIPGDRVAAVPGKEVRYRNGSLAGAADAEATDAGGTVRSHSRPSPTAPVRAVRAVVAARKGNVAPGAAARVPAEDRPSAPTLF